MAKETVAITSRELRLDKIFWGAAGKEQCVQITLAGKYGGQYLGTLTALFNIAQRDFPGLALNPENTAAVALGGDRKKHMWGIEFTVPAGTPIPATYTKTDSELILSGGL